MSIMSEKLSTDPYKGVRDFYPEDYAVQQYIFDTWAYTAESFGFERYDASVLEPADLYKAKGAENEEMVNEQTYTFTDRGDREVTLRPEMTPTVARMVAKKQKELAFPVRWYSIPNLFRYERAQRGRLREHWQLNCDIFGSDDVSVDIEIIALAHQIFMNFGATEEMFTVRVNDRREMTATYEQLGITDEETQTAVMRLTDSYHKMDESDYRTMLVEITGNDAAADSLCALMKNEDGHDTNPVVEGLRALGISNVMIDRTIARGFNYYTDTVFEFTDNHPENNRALLGGGRYDNLTGLFSNDAVPGIGFGFGDVTMKDFLLSHELMSTNITSPTLMVIPMDATLNIEGQKLAQNFRQAGFSVATDVSTRKVPKKLNAAGEAMVDYAIVLGENEVESSTYTLKNLTDSTEHSGTLETLIDQLTNNG